MAEPGILVISLDFELFWGMRDTVSLEGYRANLEGVHEVVPRTLDLFAEYDIHATWACVGLLWAQNHEEARSYLPILRPSYDERGLDPFGELDHGDLDRNARCWFAPEAMREIAARPDQEIGTHTFSHYYCREAGQNAEQFDADLGAALAISEANDSRPTSLVFPRNQCNPDYLGVLAGRGIKTYRGLRRSWAHQPADSRARTTVHRAFRLADNYAPLCPDGSLSRRGLRGKPMDIPGSRFFRPWSARLRHLDEARLRRMEREMTDAARKGRVYHLWWHPHNFGRDPEPNFGMLRRLLHRASLLRDQLGFSSMSMGEVVALDGLH